MKKLMLAGLLTIVLGFSSHANAALQNLGCGLMVGTTCQGNLIYDDVAGVTWFDYTYRGPCPELPNYDGATIDEAKQWVAGLNVGGVTGWVLPTLASECTSLTCLGLNYNCDACKVQTNNAIGNLYWGTFSKSGMVTFNNIDSGSGKSYWTGQIAANYPIAFSFYDGKLPYQPARAYAMAMHPGQVSPRLMQTVEKVTTSLTDFRSLITDEEDAAILEEAIEHSANTQNPAWWILNKDNEYVLRAEHGKEAFREAKRAVQCLNVLVGRGYNVQTFIDDIIYVARWLAQRAIDANNADSKPQNIEKGMNEMGKAAEAALERYGKAWEAVTKTAK